MICFSKSLRYLLVGMMLVMLLGSARAQTESTGGCESESLECFKLYTACQPINLLVEGLSAAADDIGLKEQAIVNAAESRLRAARIYDPSAGNHLHVNIHVVGNGVSISLRFNKTLLDLLPWADQITDQIGLAATWQVGSAGTHGSNPQSILGALSELLDSFLVEFLRVNEPACDDAQ